MAIAPLEPLKSLKLQTLRLSSAEEAGNANALAGWNLQYDQLSCGAYECQMLQIELPEAVLIHERSNQRVHQHGRMNQSAYGLALPLSMAGASSFHAQGVSENSLLLGSAEELDLCTSQVFELAGLVVAKPLLDQVWADLFGQTLPPFAQQHYVKQAQSAQCQSIRAAFRCAIDMAQSALKVDPLSVRDALIAAWVTVLSKDEAIPDVRAASARRRLVQRTVTALHSMMEEGGGDVPTLLALCRRVGASPRKMQYCFQDALGLSPKQYLRAYRLNQVRRDLLAAGVSCAGRGTVQEVAAKWGFWHFGQFSADYKRQFSELPSHTLRKH